MPEMVQNRTVQVAEVDEVEERLRLGLIVDLDAGFGDVVRTHERLVYSVALRLSTTPTDAEDAAAETFLRAYRALRDYEGARIRALRIRPWLLTILRNTARNTARDAGRRPAPPPEFEPAEPVVAGSSVEQQVERDLTRREWARLLSRLPEAQRTAVVLRHVEGMPTGEIAEILGCPEGTAKSHISRGLRRLRVLLADGAPADRRGDAPAPSGPAATPEPRGETR